MDRITTGDCSPKDSSGSKSPVGRRLTSAGRSALVINVFGSVGGRNDVHLVVGGKQTADWLGWETDTASRGTRTGVSSCKSGVVSKGPIAGALVVRSVVAKGRGLGCFGGLGRLVDQP